MTAATSAHTQPQALVAEQMRVRGTVQGVGFRPMVWRVASQLGVLGSVSNDAQGVLISAVATPDLLDLLVRRVRDELPPLARITAFERRPMALPQPTPRTFVIGASGGNSGIGDGAGEASFAAVATDAATCAACVAEIFDPFSRRYRYPFTACTDCGPRLSVFQRAPYDRANTTMAPFPLCADCAREYADPADRRFHAQATACHACG